MRTIKIQGSSKESKIFVSETIGNLKKYVDPAKTIVVTDTNVKRLYDKDLSPYKTIEIGTGEGVKTLKTVEDIFKSLIDLEADRSTFLVGVGGGIICDISGFVASTYMRGIDFGFVSSTLLSQVDASVGGKNGVNFSGYKNMVGTFSQPSFVICDVAMLKTLPEDELLSGFAEVIKHGLIKDQSLFEFLESNFTKALGFDLNILGKIVYDNIKIKASVVGKDEKEIGGRRVLNFGHTLGHAFEKTTHLSHGQAVSIGMLAAARLSEKRGLISSNDIERIKTLLTNFRLPTHLEVDKAKVKEAVGKDKKQYGDVINFVLLKKIGAAKVEKIPITELEEVIDDLY